MPLNFDLGGKTYDSVTEEVSAESIAAYATASRIENPQHAIGPDQVPPAIYPVVVGLPKMVAIATDPELQLDNPLMIVHGEEDILHHRPMRPGETLVFTPELESVEDKGKGATYVAKVTAATRDGEVVNEQRATIFVRGAGSGQPRESGPKPAPPTRGAEVASFTRHVDEGMPKDYADASGDHNPIHLDPGVATAVGLPGVINHGLGTLSIVSGGLVEALADGDAGRVKRVQVRFTDMVIPGSDLETRVFASDGDAFLFETTRPDGATVMTGLVEVGSA
jgi:acyl dehydratase